MADESVGKNSPGAGAGANKPLNKAQELSPDDPLGTSIDADGIKRTDVMARTAMTCEGRPISEAQNFRMRTAKAVRYSQGDNAIVALTGGKKS